MKKAPTANSKGKRSRPKSKLGIPHLELSKPAVLRSLGRRIRGADISMRLMSLSLGIAPNLGWLLTKLWSCGTEFTSRSGASRLGPSTYGWRP